MDIREAIREKAATAKTASYKLAVLSAQQKNKALLKMAEALSTEGATILQANALDVAEATKRGVKKSYIDRLTLTPARLAQMAEGLRQTAALPDPIWQSDYTAVRPNGLEITRKRVPLGVIGIIYEARPNVTADAAALCLKSGNAVILRGGSEAIRSNTAICRLLTQTATQVGIPDGAIQLVEVTDRAAVDVMTSLTEYINVIIPRGGAGLISHIKNISKVPVIETGTGVCHTFVDESADLNMAAEIAVNAKTSHPSVCNAMETLLVHQAVAEKFLPEIYRVLTERGVELRCTEEVRDILSRSVTDCTVKEATEEDWRTEYGDLILSVKTVADVDAAIEHINRYNTGHSETIVTQNLLNAHKFQREVDAAAVYVNASTRFTDGFEFGFGAEIGISTQKLHARGPMGLTELTSTKYLVYGNGQVRR